MAVNLATMTAAEIRVVGADLEALADKCDSYALKYGVPAYNETAATLRGMADDAFDLAETLEEM